jgi:autotransporter-associated beta strand protein
MTAGGGDVTLGGSISGTSGAIVTAGAGTLTLSGASTYSGALTVGGSTIVNQTGTFNNGAGSTSANIVVGVAAGDRVGYRSGVWRR